MSRLTILALLAILSVPAIADDGDAVMTRVMAACPGAAKFIMEGHPDMASFEAAKRAEAQTTQKSSLAPTHPKLREQLMQMVAEDRAARLGDLNTLDGSDRVIAVDARNLPYLKEIIAEHGFPTVAMVGHDGFNAAWLLLQHADADPQFQQRMLESLAASGQIGGERLALLTDRVLRHQGKPQRYGSQFMEEDGRWVPQPIEEPVAELDKRRASLGMMSMADYTCTIRVMYSPPSGGDALPAHSPDEGRRP